MATSPVETYRRMLREKPASPVFADLARALIDQGAHAEAAEVCARAVPHHPDSIFVHILWGEALLAQNQPADAMEQFNAAIALNRSNPEPYELVGALLLHKGLHRSALPVLRKAVALLPGAPEPLRALNAAERALGLPLTPAARPPAPKRPPPAEINAAIASAEPDSEPLVEPTFFGPLPGSPAAAELAAEPTLLGSLADPAPAPSADEGAPPPRVAGPPPVHANEEAVVAGLTGLFEALAPRRDDATPTPTTVVTSAAAAEDLLEHAPAAAPDSPLEISLEVSDIVPPEAQERPELATTFPCLPAVGELALSNPDALGAPVSAAAQRAEAPAPTEPAQAAEPSSKPVDEDGLEELEPIGAADEPQEPAPPAPPPLPQPGGAPLLAELPPSPDPEARPAGFESPPPAVAPEQAASIANAYERQLRSKLLDKPPPASFWRRHWLAFGAGALLALVATGVWILLGLRAQELRALELDTPGARREALRLARRVLSVAPFDARSRAVEAFAAAEPARDGEAIARFERDYPGFAAVVRARAAPQDPAASRALVEPGFAIPPGFEGAEVLSHAGRLLLAQNRPELALEKLRGALERMPAHVATLVELGNYYLREGEPDQAASFFELARGASPEHLPALVGSLQVRQQLTPNADLTGDVERARAALTREPGWPAETRASLAQLEAQLLALRGKLDDAERLLTADLGGQGARALESYAAFGEILSRAGEFQRAEKALRNALELAPGDAGLRERLARALLAQERPQEALQVAAADGDDRRLHLVRGMAWLAQGQAAKAREELSATSRNGKVPTEAAILLATLDAAQGRREVARAVLERAVTSARGERAAAAAHVALGRLALEDHRDADAAAEFATAASDRTDWEGACSLGRLELRSGKIEPARQHLQTAVERNRFHSEARLAYAQALLADGEASAALEQALKVVATAPSVAGHRAAAAAMLALGDFAGARGQLAKVAALAPRDANVELEDAAALLAGEGGSLVDRLAREARAARRDSAPLDRLGEVLLAVDDAPGARAVFVRALRIGPSDPRALIGLVASSLPEGARGVMGDAERAAKAASPELKARALAWLARVRLQVGDRAGAEEAGRAALEAGATCSDAHRTAALLALLRKEPRAARQALRRAIALSPGSAEAWYALGLLPEEAGPSVEERRAALQAALRIAPKSPRAAEAALALAKLEATP